MALPSHNKEMFRELEEILDEEGSQGGIFGAISASDEDVEAFWNGDVVTIDTPQGKYTVQIEVKKLR